MKQLISKKAHRRIESFITKYFSNIRRQTLNNTDFTIICNNCWGGYVYRRYGLEYCSPTVGLYFFADDYIKFCSNLSSYLSCPISFIDYSQSKWKSELERKQQTTVPIGKILDIEIVFLHYKTEEEAREKWERRTKRVNYNNLIFKFSKMNLCSDDALRKFDEMVCQKKICFVPPNEENKYSSAIGFPSAKGMTEIADDTSEYSRYVNIRKLINSKSTSGRKYVM